MRTSRLKTPIRPTVTDLKTLVGIGLALTAVGGCGPALKTAPRPTMAQAIHDVRSLAEDSFRVMLSNPAGAGTQLEILIETLEVRDTEYGGRFKDLLGQAKTVRISLGTRPTPQQVNEAIASLRQTVAGMKP